MSSSPALSLEEALRGARETRGLEIGPGLLASVPGVFRRHFGDRPAMLVADANTFAAAGQTAAAAFHQAAHPALAPFVFGDSSLYAESGFVDQLERALQGHNAIPVAVGSGTLNDLTKLAAYRAGRPYLCVATAASMDGYTAFGASITHAGSKQTFFCPAPTAVVADLTVIRNAPPEMAAWGYADLVAKVTAGADWILADGLGAEPLHPQAWSIVQGRLRELIADPAKIHAADPAALRRLIEGLLLGGFAMQAAQSSRPASGAEHQFSHLWDMQHHVSQGRAPSHGFKVALGTLASTALYEYLLEQPLERLDVDQCCACWPDAEKWLAKARSLLGPGPIAEVAAKELRAKHLEPDGLRAQLCRLRECWPELRQQLRAQLLPFEALREMLSTVGAPVEPEQIGISRERLRRSYWEAFCLRRRFTVLDVAVRTRLLDKGIAHVFGPTGPWPTAPAAPIATPLTPRR